MLGIYSSIEIELFPVGDFDHGTMDEGDELHISENTALFPYHRFGALNPGSEAMTEGED